MIELRKKQMKREMDKALTSLDMITCESFLAFVGRLNFAASARTLKGINKDSQDGGVGDQRRTIRTRMSSWVST